MKKIALTLVLLLLSFAALGVCNGTVVLEGYDPQDPQEIKVKFQTTANYPLCNLILKQTNSQTINLTIATTTFNWFGQNETLEIWLSIDSQNPEKLEPCIRYTTPSMWGPSYHSQYNVTLSGVEDGTHFLKLRATGGYYSYDSDSFKKYDYERNVSFTLDNKSPTFDNISIKNTTYYENDLELFCTTNEPCSWVAYSLDNQANVTIQAANDDENITNELLQAKANLTDLAEGSHDLTIYASDRVGNIGVSETIEFSVDTFMPYLVAIIVAGVIAVVLAVASVLLIARRRRS